MFDQLLIKVDETFDVQNIKTIVDNRNLGKMFNPTNGDIQSLSTLDTFKKSLSELPRRQPLDKTSSVQELHRSKTELMQQTDTVRDVFQECLTKVENIFETIEDERQLEKSNF
eukprot:UN28069